MEFVLPSTKYKNVVHEKNDACEIILLGTLHIQGPAVQCLKKLFLENGRLVDLDTCKRRLDSLSGYFAFVLRDREGSVFAAVDKVRSHPMFYSTDQSVVGFNAEACARLARLEERDPVALGEFAMAAYTTARKTMRKGLRQLEAGECFFRRSGSAAEISSYFLFFEPVNSTASERELRDELHAVTDAMFKKMVERLNGRQVLLPLSGGLDSRLVLCMLKRHGHDNIVTFSYGIAHNCEAAAAKKIAKKVGVPWFFIKYNRKKGKRIFASKMCQEYLRFAHGFSDIPVLLDYNAFQELKEKGKLQKDAVVINGQTGDFISGDHIPRTLLAAVLTPQDVYEAIAGKHYALWKPLLTKERLNELAPEIQKTLSVPVPERMDREMAMKLFELWEWRGRQSRHVVFGQRVYDFFQLDWELPLWDDAYLRFWRRIPFEQKYKQKLYRDYLNEQDFYGVFSSMKFRRYTPPFTVAFLDKACGVLGKRRGDIRRILFPYWQKYAYYYALWSYKEYRSLALAHRHPLSLHSKKILEDWYGVDVKIPKTWPSKEDLVSSL